MPRTALLALALLFLADWRAVSGAPTCEDLNGCEANFQCKELKNQEERGKVPKALCYIKGCGDAIQNHIKYEFDAAFKYLTMGAYFAQESVNRLGIAKFLLSAASEERSHAILMLDYLNKRGIQLNATNTNYEYKNNDINITIDYKDALIQALNMEIKVTELIYKVIKACDKDFHGADVFTNPILDEQHEGVRHLQGAVKVFNNLAEGVETDEYRKYAEYIFDMKLLKGEIIAH